MLTIVSLEEVQIFKTQMQVVCKWITLNNKYDNCLSKIRAHKIDEFMGF